MICLCHVCRMHIWDTKFDTRKIKIDVKKTTKRHYTICTNIYILSQHVKCSRWLKCTLCNVFFPLCKDMWTPEIPHSFTLLISAFLTRVAIWDDGSLEIINITVLDEGSYTCFAENNRGKANSTTTLSVKGNAYRQGLSVLRLAMYPWITSTAKTLLLVYFYVL